MTDSGARHIVEITIDAAYEYRCEPALLVGCIRATLVSQRLRKPRAVSLLVTDSRRVRRLNRRFRGDDRATDVLAFNTDFPGLSRPDGAFELGEIVIALPVAARGARERSRTLREELALLTVHGVLHLLGHDHETNSDDSRMRELERSALTRVGLPQAARPVLVPAKGETTN